MMQVLTQAGGKFNCCCIETSNFLFHAHFFQLKIYQATLYLPSEYKQVLSVVMNTYNSQLTK